MIDKSSFPTPDGLLALAEPEIELELGTEDDTSPMVVELDDGGVEVTLDPSTIEEDALDAPFDANLAEYLDDSDLHLLASDLLELVDADVLSRKEWADTFVKGLEVLGLQYEERTEPWDGACGVYSSVLSEAAIRFQAETMSETFPAAGPVKTKVLGATTREKEKAAERVREDMNYALTEVMTEYRPEHERMLYSLGLAGSAFKKVYDDPIKDRQTSVFIPAEDMIVPYGASVIEDAERVTHVMRKTKHEVESLQASGFYRDTDLGDPLSFPSDIEKKKAEEGGYSLTDDDRFTILEIHTYTRIAGFDEDDELAKPYVITVERGNNTVLSIRRNWKEDDARQAKQQHFVHYTYVPGFGFYGLGLIHIVGGYARAGTSLIRQLVDSGTLANMQSGLKARGLRIKGDDTPIAPGEFRDVDVPSGSIRDNIMPLPYKEPSQVLMALLNQITEEARRLGSVADMKVSDMSANAPVGTTLAILERQLKTMSAVQARVHFSMKEEFKLLKDIIRDNAPESYDYDPVGGDRQLKQSDYDMVNVIPVSDPNSATMAQRIMQYQAVIQLSQTAPQIYDLPHLHRQMIEVLGIKNADKLIPLDDEQKPNNADGLLSIVTTVTQTGIPLPPEGEDLPPQVVLALSSMMAQAAQQVLQENQAQAAQEQAQQQAQDPVLQMQQQELKIKEGELALKEKKLQIDASTKADELELKKQALEGKMELDGFKAGQQAQQAEKKLQADQEREGVRMGIDIAKSKQQEAAQARAMAQKPRGNTNK